MYVPKVGLLAQGVACHRKAVSQCRATGRAELVSVQMVVLSPHFADFLQGRCYGVGAFATVNRYKGL